MQQIILFTVVMVAMYMANIDARLAGECAMMCNDLRFDVLTMEMCRDAKRTLPRPKVGDFCSTAMEQGFSDACVAICMEQMPVARVAQTCRAAAIEMPRPTVRRWCEHGYNVAFEKTVKDLKNHFTTDVPDASSVTVEEVSPAKVEEAVHEEPAAKIEPAEKVEPEPAAEEAPAASKLRGGGGAAADSRPILATIPITIEDEELNLVVHEGENAEEAVVVFCREHVPADVSSCIRQLLSTVIEKLEEDVASA